MNSYVLVYRKWTGFYTIKSNKLNAIDYLKQIILASWPAVVMKDYSTSFET